ncbi:MAG: hypothetical protein VW547_11680 [Alphaproteobacteria bacterium]|jgi:hypothetical protein
MIKRQVEAAFSGSLTFKNVAILPNPLGLISHFFVAQFYWNLFLQSVFKPSTASYGAPAK